MISDMVKCECFGVRFILNYDSCFIIIYRYIWLIFTVIVIGVWRMNFDKNFNCVIVIEKYKLGFEEF